MGRMQRRRGRRGVWGVGGVGWMRRLGPTAAHVTKGDAAHATDPRIIRIHHGRHELAKSDVTRGRPGPMKGRRDHDVDVDLYPRLGRVRYRVGVGRHVRSIQNRVPRKEYLKN